MKKIILLLFLICTINVNAISVGDIYGENSKKIRLTSEETNYYDLVIKDDETWVQKGDKRYYFNENITVEKKDNLFLFRLTDENTEFTVKENSISDRISSIKIIEDDKIFHKHLVFENQGFFLKSETKNFLKDSLNEREKNYISQTYITRSSLDKENLIYKVSLKTISGEEINVQIDQNKNVEILEQDGRKISFGGTEYTINGKLSGNELSIFKISESIKMARVWLNESALNEMYGTNKLEVIDQAKLNTLTGKIVKVTNVVAKALIFLSVVIIGMKLIIERKAPVERAKTMYGLFYVAIGAFILANLMLLSSYVVSGMSGVSEIVNSTEVNMSMDILNNENTQEDINEERESVFGKVVMIAVSNVIGSLLAIINLILTFIIRVFQWLKKMMMGDLSTIKTLVFLVPPSGTAFNNYAPFTPIEWNAIIGIYDKIRILISPVLLMVIAKTGFDYINSATSVKKREQLKGGVSKWFYAVLLITFGPIIFKTGLYFFNNITAALPIENMQGTFDGILKVQNTSGWGGLNSELAKIFVNLMYVFIEIKIIIIFFIRKIMLILLFLLMPIIAMLWAANTTANTVRIWTTEFVSNLMTQFVYAISFFVMAFLIRGQNHNFVYVYLWLFLVVKMAARIKGSVLTLFAAKQSFNEEALAENIYGSVAKNSTIKNSLNGMKFIGQNIKEGANELLNDKPKFEKNDPSEYARDQIRDFLPDNELTKEELIDRRVSKYEKNLEKESKLTKAAKSLNNMSKETINIITGEEVEVDLNNKKVDELKGEAKKIYNEKKVNAKKRELKNNIEEDK